eukprot:m.119968 g.119968  ORF g.119968 m.119968 type:complete len:410 (+) comp13328_c0_seq2:32-1261(+)
MRAAGSLLAVGLLALGSQAQQQIDPRYAVNITVYHQDRKSAGAGISDRNTGDALGDMYFTLKDAGLPVECAEDPRSFDCQNPEVNNKDLVVSLLVVEVDSRFGVYGLCNVDNTTGEYFCQCPRETSASVASAEPDTIWTCSVCGHVYDPAKDGNGTAFEDLPDTWKCPVCGAPKSMYKPTVTADGRTVWVHEEETKKADPTQQCASALSSSCGIYKGKEQFCEYCEEKNYQKLEAAGCSREDFYTFCFGDKPSCNASVGRLAVVDNQSVERVPTPGRSYDFEFWNYNMAHKFNGFWYSTMASGQCNASGTGPCYWRVVESVKTVQTNCQRANVYSVVEKNGAPCFSQCPSPTDNTTKCWVDCYFDTVLGTGSSTSITDPNAGMSVSTLRDAWTAAFNSEDPSKGGCPAV